MTSAMTRPSVRLRAPRWTRVYALVFGVLWSGLLLTFAIRAPHANIPVTAGMLAFGAILIGSTLRLGVTATGDHLVIRNRVTTTTLTREDVEGFREGSAPNQGLPLSHCVYALTHEGRVIPLTVTSRVGLRGPSEHVRGDVERLRRWLADTTDTTRC